MFVTGAIGASLFRQIGVSFASGLEPTAKSISKDVSSHIAIPTQNPLAIRFQLCPLSFRALAVPAVQIAAPAPSQDS
jgi:hypothetical protein